MAFKSMVVNPYTALVGIPCRGEGCGNAWYARKIACDPSTSQREGTGSSSRDAASPASRKGSFGGLVRGSGRGRDVRGDAEVGAGSAGVARDPLRHLVELRQRVEEVGIARLRGKRRLPFVERARVLAFGEILVAEIAVGVRERFADLLRRERVDPLGNDLSVPP